MTVQTHTMPAFDNTDIRHQGAYSLAEAARYLKLPQATLRAWAIGRDYPGAEGQGRFKALITPGDIEQAALFQRAA